MHEDFTRRQNVAVASDRSFGFVMAGAFAVLSALSWWRSGAMPVRLLAASGSLALLAVAWPRILRPLARLWIRFGLILHRITTPVILGAMFYLVLTPVARVARLFGHVWLPLAKEPNAETYWQKRGGPHSSMQNQY